LAYTALNKPNQKSATTLQAHYVDYIVDMCTLYFNLLTYCSFR